jgi:hypothetical protein
MKDIRDDIELGVIRRRNERLMVDQIAFLQDLVREQSREMAALDERINALEGETVRNTIGVVKLQTERSLVLTVLEWFGQHGWRIAGLVLPSLGVIFYDHLVDFASRVLLQLKR